MKRVTLRPVGPAARPNPDGFVDHHGIFHPIRNSVGYRDQIPVKLAEERKREGIDTADQQVQRQFERHERTESTFGPYKRKLEELKIERSGMVEALREDPAADLTKLIRGTMRAGHELDAITPERAARLTGISASSWRKRAIKLSSSASKDNNRVYVPVEYFLDELADEAGYSDGASLKRGIERASKQRERIAKLGRQIGNVEHELRQKRETLNVRSNPARAASSRPTRRNPSWWHDFKERLIGALIWA